MREHKKTLKDPPENCFYFEAAGINWLQEAKLINDNACSCVKVLSVSKKELILEKINTIIPNRLSAFNFGVSLYYTHKAGAKYFGAKPDNYKEQTYFGPSYDLLLIPHIKSECFSDYYINRMVEPFIEYALKRKRITVKDQNEITKIYPIVKKIEKKITDDFFHKPARVHGDLWDGNILWTHEQFGTKGVLIDPSAHGGCFELDLSTLALFGFPMYQQVLAGYKSVHKIDDGFEKRMTLHQLPMILAHCVFFGGGYVGQALNMAKEIQALYY